MNYPTPSFHDTAHSADSPSDNYYHMYCRQVKEQNTEKVAYDIFYKNPEKTRGLRERIERNL